MTNYIVNKNSITAEEMEKLKRQFAESVKSANNSWKMPIILEESIPDLIIWPNDTLKLKSVELHELSLAQSLADDMFKVMYKYKGAGLSAIQIGIPYRLVVMDCKEPLVLVNPVIKEFIDTPVELNEGCLSFPGVWEKVFRYPEVIVEAQNHITGERITYQMEGLESQCIQHELDHLEGVTIGDNWGRVKRDIAKRKINKALNEYI